MSVDRELVFIEVRKFVEEYSPKEGLNVREDTGLDELGLDSIDFMEIAFKLDDVFNIELRLEEIRDLSTISDLTDFVMSEIATA